MGRWSGLEHIFIIIHLKEVNIFSDEIQSNSMRLLWIIFRFQFHFNNFFTFIINFKWNARTNELHMNYEKRWFIQPSYTRKYFHKYITSSVCLCDWQTKLKYRCIECDPVMVTGWLARLPFVVRMHFRFTFYGNKW